MLKRGQGEGGEEVVSEIVLGGKSHSPVSCLKWGGGDERSSLLIWGTLKKS